VCRRTTVIVPTSHLDPRIVEGTATAGVTVEVIEVDPLEEHELSTLACSSLHAGHRGLAGRGECRLYHRGPGPCGTRGRRPAAGLEVTPPRAPDGLARDRRLRCGRGSQPGLRAGRRCRGSQGAAPRRGSSICDVAVEERSGGRPTYPCASRFPLSRPLWPASRAGPHANRLRRPRLTRPPEPFTDPGVRSAGVPGTSP
jgi:hypothetical protein